MKYREIKPGHSHADPRHFDQFGLFRLDSVCFSPHGSLTSTVTRLVYDAEAGRTYKELRSLLHVPSHACQLDPSPVIDLSPSVRHSPGCGGELRVQKSEIRTIATATL